MIVNLLSVRFVLISGVLIIFWITVSISCMHNSEGLEKIPLVSFSKDVLPIFQTSCAKSGCHDAFAAGGKIFTDYNKIMQGGIKPYDSQNSHVYKVLHKAWGDIMPPDGPLTIEQRTLIRLWIDQGAQNN